MEAIGCEQLAQSRYAAAPGRGSNANGEVDHSRLNSDLSIGPWVGQHLMAAWRSMQSASASCRIPPGRLDAIKEAAIAPSVVKR